MDQQQVANKQQVRQWQLSRQPQPNNNRLNPLPLERSICMTKKAVIRAMLFVFGG
jgi:hypothetical protein